MIYRVTVRTTNSVQPTGTHWLREVIYCGTSLEDARVAFLGSEALDFGGGYGNRARETVIEGFESEPEGIHDREPAEVEMAEE